MQIDRNLARVLGVLQRKYRVSERDLVNLVKRLQSVEEEPDNFEENLQQYLAFKKQRAPRRMA
jgi:asparagine synthetase B (glutamine-hydrolysing)